MPGSSDQAVAERPEDAPVRCIVVDDHPLIVEALQPVLEQKRIEIVGRCRLGSEAIDALAATDVDLAIMDVSLPDITGVEVLREIRRRGIETSVIFFTAFADRGLVTEAIDAGAQGFVMKGSPVRDLVWAIEVVMSGGTFVDPVLAGEVIGPRQGDAEVQQLTTREREVLRLLAAGHTTKEIARELTIAPDTARTHIQNAMRRLGAETRAQAIAIALRRGLIT